MVILSDRPRSKTKVGLLGLAGLLSLGLVACGQARKGPTAAFHRPSTAVALGVTLPQPELKTDAELDSDSYPGEPDNDNNHVFGHAASAADARAATALVKRYYAAAAAGNGAAACRLLYSPMAESIPEAYGPLAGTSAKSCPAIMSSLFRHQHKQLSVDSATLKVAAVRIRGNQASVLMAFETMKPKDYLELHRERGHWKIDRLLATEQPIYVE
jgi:hypothetical protein